jgi:hypothetical protein
MGSPPSFSLFQHNLDPQREYPDDILSRVAVPTRRMNITRDKCNTFGKMPYSCL